MKRNTQRQNENVKRRVERREKREEEGGRRKKKYKTREITKNS